jgi:hypothetical protein
MVRVAVRAFFIRSKEVMLTALLAEASIVSHLR